MQNHSFTANNLDHNDVGKLLNVVLSNDYFTFDDVTYQQINGLAMGNSVSAILAILYMDYV